MTNSLVLTEKLKPQDKFDEFLLSDILLMVQSTTTLELIKAWIHSSTKIEKGEELFLKDIILVVTSLFKLNAHRRNYYRVMDDLLVQLNTDTAIANTTIDVIFESVDAYVEIDGFFTKTKTSLDLLAQSLKPIYGTNFQTWMRDKDRQTNEQLSGQKIINFLERNLHKDIQPHAKELLKLMKLHAQAITKIIRYRDDVTHYGESKNIKGFRYYVTSKEITPPIIVLGKSRAMYVHEYMDDVSKYIANFVQQFLVAILSNLIEDMYIKKNANGEWNWYKR